MSTLEDARSPGARAPAEAADLVIVGAGIAGSAAAYFASLRARRCIVIDARLDQASSVPTALINPIRGYRARCSFDDIEGARFTFALIERLRAEGHPVGFGRGLWRPIPDAEQRDLWASLLPVELRHRWTDGHILKTVLKGSWAATLFLPDSGWVDTASFLSALRSGSSAEWVDGRVASVDARSHTLVLDDGQCIRARTLLWCGGAYGAAGIARQARFRPGGVLRVGRLIHPEALSYGLYCAPHGEGSVIGSTTEAQYTNYPPAWESRAPLERLTVRARSVFRGPIEPGGDWHGVRLESADLPPGLASLGPFGSRGYLLAPQAAKRWALTL